MSAYQLQRLTRLGLRSIPNAGTTSPNLLQSDLAGLIPPGGQLGDGTYVAIVIVGPTVTTGNVHIEAATDATLATFVPIDCLPGADLIVIAAAGNGWILPFGFPWYAVRFVSDAAEAAQRDFIVLYQPAVDSPG